ncbi:hypothetical protein F4212_12930 [Candidatus Poribacteria bacterium]|nr:hypothetical protein [Candidatus Poribacteria bacterium]
MRRYRRYIRYFVIGFILAALTFGSIGIKVIHSDTTDSTQCECYSSGRSEPVLPKIEPLCIPRFTPQCPDGSPTVPKRPLCPNTRQPCPQENTR